MKYMYRALLPSSLQHRSVHPMTSPSNLEPLVAELLAAAGIRHIAIAVQLARM